MFTNFYITPLFLDIALVVNYLIRLSLWITLLKELLLITLNKFCLLLFIAMKEKLFIGNSHNNYSFIYRSLILLTDQSFSINFETIK